MPLTDLVRLSEEGFDILALTFGVDAPEAEAGVVQLRPGIVFSRPGVTVREVREKLGLRGRIKLWTPKAWWLSQRLKKGEGKIQW